MKLNLPSRRRAGLPRPGMKAGDERPASPGTVICERLGAARITALMWLLSPVLLVMTAAVLALGFAGIVLAGLRGSPAGGFRPPEV